MKQHLICLDLDGTLLNDDKNITPYTFKVLKTLQSQGHAIMISTGRPYRASKRYYDELNMDTPVVNFNGAYVHHPKDAQFPTQHARLDEGIATCIIDTLKTMNVQNMIAEVMDQVYLDRYDENLFEGFSMGDANIQVGDLRTLLKEDPTSLLIEADEHQIPRIKKILTRFYAENIEHRRWGAPFPVIEIVKRGISKAVGIDIVKDYLQIERQHIIAFGDEDNDIEMIKYAKHGVAMANAIPELKHVAKETTASNNEDGIGIYLNHYFQLNITKDN
ncbi:Cof-type HAD-IIB family hydrolase [Staphylococcus hyicus]|uniref:Cof-type HAD-IIB family hydrolase n=1 Tax=Staphylococcus hyicus TaxID=1284 RepID=UPI00057E9E92|nr:Cof-type HAD-IIB family hydrolase [Staphylococcus hyicus]AJC96615.1 Cof family hydrolase [Staphylococcus hyicus]MCQ9290240.1 Cof-type HAD-IIB family hydrolase [Staphylococcus hyicus]MCQ9305481.1 Cof-type HAD-IIB family hydrolase [Staphylococcus hyicus]MCQ9307893.1 Cof-type HAD-IIB family hydrolase [Staphylococcus hyicus]MCQ9310316.1 Cof-type HAD-IIB family hydrolase [Staphylococcus hyicus]